MRRLFITVLATGFVSVSVQGIALAQTTFSEIAGKWEGVNAANGNKVELTIDPEGKFTIMNHRGQDSGTGKLNGASAVFAFTKNAGNATVTKKGDVLDGTVTVGNVTSPVTFSRKK